jgi:hypothetical protein
VGSRARAAVGRRRVWASIDTHTISVFRPVQSASSPCLNPGLWTSSQQGCILKDLERGQIREFVDFKHAEYPLLLWPEWFALLSNHSARRQHNFGIHPVTEEIIFAAFAGVSRYDAEAQTNDAVRRKLQLELPWPIPKSRRQVLSGGEGG